MTWTSPTRRGKKMTSAQRGETDREVPGSFVSKGRMADPSSSHDAQCQRIEPGGSSWGRGMKKSPLEDTSMGCFRPSRNKWRGGTGRHLASAVIPDSTRLIFTHLGSQVSSIDRVWEAVPTRAVILRASSSGSQTGSPDQKNRPSRPRMNSWVIPPGKLHVPFLEVPGLSEICPSSLQPFSSAEDTQTERDS